MDRIYLSAPDLSGNEFAYVKEAFDSNWIAPAGPNLSRFEKCVGDLVDKKHALALSSGTAAMHLALMHIGIHSGDVVFCSDLTFAGSCNPIFYEGAEAVFIDSEPCSWNMSATALRKAFEEADRTGRLPRAVIIVNLYGQSADMDELVPICREYRVPVIEDAAESLGACYKGRKSGSYGDYTIVSFNGNKIVTTSGGGMLLSDRSDVIDKCRFWSTQSRENEIHYEHREIGYNYRMSNVLAGIGLGQCEKLPGKISGRKSIFEAYQRAFSDLPGIEMMPIPRWSLPNYWLTVLTFKRGSGIIPSDVVAELSSENIESRPVWKPMHLQPVFSHCRFIAHEEGRAVSEDLFERGLCLPSGTKMTQMDQERVIAAVRTYVLRGECR